MKNSVGYIEANNVKFYNKVVNGFSHKMGSPNTDSNIGYITEFDDPDTVLNIVNNLQLAISGNFDSILDTDVSTDSAIAFIIPDGVEFYAIAGSNELSYITTVPLRDIYDLAVAWRNFLMEPPLNFTKVDGDQESK